MCSPRGTGFVAVAAGGRHSAALKSNQTVETASLDTYRQQLDIDNAVNLLAIAKGIYYRLAVLGEPAILLLLGIIAVLLL